MVREEIETAMKGIMGTGEMEKEMEKEGEEEEADVFPYRLC